MTEPRTGASSPVDWEAFYRSYRKPGYVPGYEVTTKLGGGMFGLVFKATKQSIGKDYAIKFLKVDDEEVRRAVLAELDAAPFFAQVDHPNLVAVEDRGVVDGIPYLVMAYAGSETLRDRLAAPDRDPDELMRLFLQACRGVQALHEHSLVHFDLKPANIFVKGSVARVGDYGLAKLVAQSRQSLSMGRGTPYYMAPEMLQRRGDARSDVYSLGVILYEIATGELPFRGDSEWEVLRKHETAAPAYPAGMPEPLRAVLARALAKDPAARFASPAELMAALGAPITAPFDAGASPAAGRVAPPPTPGVDPHANLRRAAMGLSQQACTLASEAVKSARIASRDAYAHLGPMLRSQWERGAAGLRARRRARRERLEMRRWRRQQRRPRRRAWMWVAAVLVLGAVLAGRADRPRPATRLEPRAWGGAPGSTWAVVGDVPPPAPVAPSLPTARVAVDIAAAAAPEDVPRDELERARHAARLFADGHTEAARVRLERLGYAGLLAVAELLAQLDGDDPEGARRAERLRRFLDAFAAARR